MDPRATNHMASASQIVQAVEFEAIHSGDQCLGNCQTSHTSATHRVQVGTNRPSGKIYRKMPKVMAPRDRKNATGTCQAKDRAASTLIVSGKVAIPNVSRAIETSSAMRSSGLRQKIRAATAPYTAAKMMSITTAYAA